VRHLGGECALGKPLLFQQLQDFLDVASLAV
jgi:hypothetical protein